MPGRPRAERLVLAAFAVLATYLAIALPPYTGADESLHVEYADFLRRERRLPEPFREFAGNDKHPPAYYAAAAAVVAAGERLAPRFPDAVPLPGPFAGELSLARQERSLATSVSGLSLLLLRLASIAATLVGLRFVLRCVRVVVPEAGGAALGAVAFFAFNPLFLLQSSIVSNDASCFALGSVAAFLLLHGVAGEGRFRAALAGAIAGLAFLVKTNAVVLLPVGLAAVAARRRRPGARPLREAAFFVLAWGVLAGPWIVRSLARFGEPLGIGGWIAMRGSIFYPGPRGLPLLDASIGDLFFSFWEPGPDATAGRVARLFYGLVVAAGGIGAALRIFHPRVRAEAPRQAPLLALCAIAAGAFYALVVLGNLSVPSVPGRLLFPALGFLAPLLAAGAPVTLRMRTASAALAASAAAAAALAIGYVFSALVPSHRLPKSAFTEDTIAYLDCGHPTAQAACRRGVAFRPHFLFGRPRPAHTAWVDPERAEAEVGGLDPAVPAIVEVTYAAFDVLFDDRYGADLELEVRPTVQSLRAGTALLHGPLTVTHRARRYAFPLPAEAIEGGKVRLAFEKHAGRSALVGEIRVRRAPDAPTLRLESSTSGEDLVRVAFPRGAPPRGARLSAWFTPANEPGRILDRHMHAPRDAAEAAFPIPATASPRLRCLVRLVDPEVSPFATVEAETLPHPGWRVFADPEASDRYMVRATEGWTPAGALLRCDPGAAPPGTYLVRVRYSASGRAPAAGAAFGTPLPGTGDGYRVTEAIVDGPTAGEIRFGGTGRLVVDRISWTPIAGAAARADASLEIERP